ncbi:MAG TPA: hypothetical protein VFP25_02680 [Nitrososphaeraceae archaeon]|nr:hypothetical protein [Nitrososphaeraceae archaeon]
MDLTSLILNNCLYKYDIKNCYKLIIKDGIASDFFLIGKYANIFDAIEFHTVSLRKTIPSIGESISIIKNLDYYQDLICKTIPNLADNNPLKIILQKLRILIIGAFSKLSRLICCLDKNGIEQWNKISGSLLEIVSTTIVSYRSNNGLENHQSALDKATSFFIFFGLDLERIDDALKDLYL